jgi:hypothetical protein
MKKKDIKYALTGVSIEQFATPFEPSSDDVNLQLDIQIKTNYVKHALAIGANIQFLEEDRAFLIAEVFCHYLIEPETWKELSEDDSKDVVLPKDLVRNLVALTVSSTRGVICAKTEKTPFAKYYLPLVFLNPEQVNDLTIPKSE